MTELLLERNFQGALRKLRENLRKWRCTMVDDQSGHPSGLPSNDSVTSGIVVSYALARPTVHVTGRVEQTTVTALSDAIRQLLAVGVDEFVVDLSGAHNGSALLPVLAQARADLARQEGALRVVGIALPDFLDALATAPLEQVFLIYVDVRDQTPPNAFRQP